MAAISSNGYVSYHNYIKYWAKNGQYNWICNTSEYSGSMYNLIGEDMELVQKTYLVKSFWNQYNGTTSPVDGSKLSKKANGFE